MSFKLKKKRRYFSSIKKQYGFFDHAKKQIVSKNKGQNNIVSKKTPIKYNFLIQTTPYLLNIGIRIRNTLKNLNLDAECMSSNEIITNIKNKNIGANIIFIFLFIEKIRIIPDNPFYIYNLEQYARFKNTYLIGSRREGESFLKEAYEKSIGIFDYSKCNIKYFPKTLCYKVVHLPIPLNHVYKNNNNQQKHKILFFGCRNKRRNKIFNYINNYTNINIVNINNVFGEKLNSLIEESIIILNIHFEKQSILETARIHDILKINSDAIIISEESVDNETMDKYKNIVEFVPEIKDDLSNIQIFIETLEYFIKKTIGNKNKLQLTSRHKEICIIILSDEIENIYKKYFKKYVALPKQIQKHPYLFHKYALNLLNPINAHIKYETLQQDQTSLKFQSIRNTTQYIDNIHERQSVKYYAHLHCYDISKFDEIYGEYIDKLKKYFKIIITFSTGEIKKINHVFVILKIPNKGMDVGGKFVMMEYLKRNKLTSDFIFMLHSKSDKKRREMYFKPLFENLATIVSKLNTNIGICVPDIIHGKNIKGWGKNTGYVNELLTYLNIAASDNMFPEGNCYIINTKLAMELFSDKHLYHSLNDEISFDVNWVKSYYNVKLTNMKDIYSEWESRKLFGNNIHSKKGYEGMPDGQIEHAFERVIFHLCKKYNKRIIKL